MMSKKCIEDIECDIYTYFSNNHENSNWQGLCIRCYHSTSGPRVSNQYATSGEKYYYCSNRCYPRDVGVSWIDSVIDDPTNPPPGCKTYGYRLPGDAVSCGMNCLEDFSCDVYTSISNNHSHPHWNGTCFGCTFSASGPKVSNIYATSGEMDDCSNHCFTTPEVNISRIDGVIDNPRAPPPGCVILRRLAPEDDVEECERGCLADIACEVYTVFSDSHPVFELQRRCFGCTFSASGPRVPDQYATSGEKYDCTNSTSIPTTIAEYSTESNGDTPTPGLEDMSTITSIASTSAFTTQDSCEICINGICNRQNGTCDCFPFYIGGNCERVVNLTAFIGSGQWPGLDINDGDKVWLYCDVRLVEPKGAVNVTGMWKVGDDIITNNQNQSLRFYYESIVYATDVWRTMLVVDPIRIWDTGNFTCFGTIPTSGYEMNYTDTVNITVYGRPTSSSTSEMTTDATSTIPTTAIEYSTDSIEQTSTHDLEDISTTSTIVSTPDVTTQDSCQLCINGICLQDGSCDCFPFYIGGNCDIEVVIDPGMVDNIKTTDGEKLRVYCNITLIEPVGSVNVIGMWKVGDNLITNNENPELRFYHSTSLDSVDPSHYVTELAITPVKSWDAGTITCIATIPSSGLAMNHSTTAVLHVQERPKASLTPINLATTNLTADSSGIKYTCSIMNGTNYPIIGNVTWQYADNDIGASIDTKPTISTLTITEFTPRQYETKVDYLINCTVSTGSGETYLESDKENAKLTVHFVIESPCQCKDGDFDLPEVIVNNNATIPCGHDQEGFKVVPCVKTGDTLCDWGKIDETNCIDRNYSLVIQKIQDIINSGASSGAADSVLDELEDLTTVDTNENGGISEGNIKGSVEAMYTLAGAREQASGDDPVTDDEIESVISVVSNIVDETNQNSWDSINMVQGQNSTTTVLVQTVDTYTTAKINSIELGTELILPSANLGVHLKSIHRIDRENYASMNHLVCTKAKFLEEDSSFFSHEYDSITISDDTIKDKGTNVSVFCVIWKTLHSILPNRTSAIPKGYDDLVQGLNTKVLSLTFAEGPQKGLNPPIEISFVDINRTEDHGADYINKAICAFWNETSEEWDTHGCEISDNSPDFRVICHCNHTTLIGSILATLAEFAVTIASYIGAFISTVEMSAMEICFGIFWKQLRSKSTLIQANLCIALSLTNITFMTLLGLHGDLSAEPETCLFLTITLHYFFLVGMITVLSEGVQLYICVVQDKIKFRNAIRKRAGEKQLWKIILEAETEDEEEAEEGGKCQPKHVKAIIKAAFKCHEKQQGKADEESQGKANHPKPKPYKETYFLIVMAWLLPIGIVGTVVGAVGPESYIMDLHDHCWINIRGNVLYAFIGPATIICLVNFIIVIMVICKLKERNINKDEDEKSVDDWKNKDEYRRSLLNVVVLSPLVGITWILALFVFNNKWADYLFSAATASEGAYTVGMNLIPYVQCPRIIFSLYARRRLAMMRKKQDPQLTTMTIFDDDTEKGIGEPSHPKVFHSIDPKPKSGQKSTEKKGLADRLRGMIPGTKNSKKRIFAVKKGAHKNKIKRLNKIDDFDPLEKLKDDQKLVFWYTKGVLPLRKKNTVTFHLKRASWSMDNPDQDISMIADRNVGSVKLLMK